MAHPKILLHVITNHVSFIVLDARKYVYPGGGHLPQVWVLTVKMTPKAVAVTSSGRVGVILKPLYSEAVGHL